MRWFVAGANGMLRDLCEVLEAAGHDVTRRDLPELDILDAAQCPRSRSPGTTSSPTARPTPRSTRP